MLLRRMAGKKPTKKPAARKKAPTPAARKRNPPMHARKVAVPTEAPERADASEAFEIFKSFDRDGSGSIDAAELSRLLEALGQHPDEDELEIALSAIDSNDSGRISWHEFKAWWDAR